MATVSATLVPEPFLGSPEVGSQRSHSEVTHDIRLLRWRTLSVGRDPRPAGVSRPESSPKPKAEREAKQAGRSPCRPGPNGGSVVSRPILRTQPGGCLVLPVHHHARPDGDRGIRPYDVKRPAPGESRGSSDRDRWSCFAPTASALAVARPGALTVVDAAATGKAPPGR